MLERKYENEAKTFCDAIRKFAISEDALENLEGYLSMHFEYWLERFANCPENIAGEMKHFSEIYD